jgi:hypothetical protein
MGKVFPTSGFKQLFEQFQASYAEGGAHIFPATYEVRVSPLQLCCPCLLASLPEYFVVLLCPFVGCVSALRMQ